MKQLFVVLLTAFAAVAAAPDWQRLPVPGYWEKAGPEALKDYNGFAWYRCFVEVPADWKGRALKLRLDAIDDCDETFVNGRKIGATGTMPPDYHGLCSTVRDYVVPADAVRFGAWNLIAVRAYDASGWGGFVNGGQMLKCAKGSVKLEGMWAFRTGDDLEWAQWPVKPGSKEGRTMAEEFAKTFDAIPGSEGVAFAGEAHAPESDLTLWYRKPAREWIEALPVGNGRLGAMVFGAVHSERIQLNEESVWDGYERDTTNPKALESLPEVRRLLFEGNNAEAKELAARDLMGRPMGVHSYQSLGDLRLRLPKCEEVGDYRRDLDLDTGVASVRFVADGVRYTREVFASAPAQVVVVRLAADQPAAVNLELTITREQDAACASVGEDGLALTGQIQRRHHDTGEVVGLRFEALLRALPQGGAMTNRDGTLSIECADEVVLLLAAATDYRDRGSDPRAACAARLDSAAQHTYPQLRAAHVDDHRALFRRVALDLGPSLHADRPTDERLEQVRGGASDPQLVELYFQFGRYLLIGSSRPGGLPANLQGVWNEHMSAPWNSDYHTNINLQMNYWPAEVANLAECHLPLFDYMDSLVASGERTAQVHYGARGWVVHHLSDLFGFTTPADGVWGVWPVGAAWLCQHPYEHYLFSRDRDFLATRAYPLMKGAALFMLDFLVEDPQGRLVTSPSHSPENSFRKLDGTTSMFTYGATMDLEIIHDLFTHCIDASEILETDAGLREELRSTLERLAPLQISQESGRLQEWIEDYEEPDPGHRHMSHLFGLHPGNQITLRGTPELAAAVRKSLEHRLSHGGGHTGWSRAWIVSFWARLEEGEKAHQNVQALLAKATLPNLFDTHPPFQIDGNFGGTAGIAEMLVQSHAGEIGLLPALPKAWPEGHFEGLRARGGFEIDAAWRHGRLTRAAVCSTAGGTCRLRSPNPLRLEREAATTAAPGNVVEFATQAGQRYQLYALK